MRLVLLIMHTIEIVRFNCHWIPYNSLNFAEAGKARPPIHQLVLVSFKTGFNWNWIWNWIGCHTNCASILLSLIHKKELEIESSVGLRHTASYRECTITSRMLKFIPFPARYGHTVTRPSILMKLEIVLAR